MYLFLIVLMIVFTWKFDFSRRKTFNKKSYCLLYLLFVLISGFRYRLGVDSVMYEAAFQEYPPFSNYVWGMEYNSDSRDIFWAILNSLCRSITDSFVLVQMVMAVFVNGIMFWFIKKHSSYPFLAVLLYFFTLWPLLTFEALREAMAVTFYIFALEALIDKNNYKKYYLRVWPACFFHTFGFMVFFFPLISLIKPCRATYIITLSICIVVITCGYMFSDFILPYITLDGLAADKVMRYLNSDVYGTNTWSVGGVIAIVFGYVFPIVIMINILKKDNTLRWIIPYLLFMLVVSLFKISLPIMYRFFNYFYIVLIVAMTESIRCSENSRFKHRQAIMSMLIFVFMVLYAYSKPAGASKYPSIYRYYPYNSIFTKDVNIKTESALPL